VRRALRDDSDRARCAAWCSGASGTSFSSLRITCAVTSVGAENSHPAMDDAMADGQSNGFLSILPQKADQVVDGAVMA